MSADITSPSTTWKRFRSSRFKSRKGGMETSSSLCTHMPRSSSNQHIFSSPQHPSPPNPSKRSMSLSDANKPQAHKADLRWSEVVQAPATAITFGALFDPEEGIVTFSGAELASPRYQALSRSQILTIDGGDADLPSTAQGSSFFPYAHSRFAASELSTARFPASPTRRSSAGTGLPLDKTSPVDPRYHLDDMMQSNHIGATRTQPSIRYRHQHNNSGDSGSSHTLTALGVGLCRAFRRETPPRPSLSKEDRYDFLERTAGKDINDFSTSQSQSFEDDLKGRLDSGPKSAGLKSIFARSIWTRSAMHFGCDSRPVCGTEDIDSIILDSGFEHFDGDSGVGVSCENGPFSLEKELNRDRQALKSSFSWTTTSTSRYIDVAEFLEDDSDSDSTITYTHTGLHAPPPHVDTDSVLDMPIEIPRDADSEWLPIEPPTPRPDLAFSTQHKIHRKLVKKRSGSTFEGSPGGAREGSKRSEFGCHRYRICPQCDLRIEDGEIELSEENDIVRVDKKSKGRSNSHPEISGPFPLRSSVVDGRPAVQRSASSPATMLPQNRPVSAGATYTPSPAEVLSRSSYNHEWTAAVEASAHNRSLSEPKGFTKEATISQGSHLRAKPCRHAQFLGVRDVLRGVQTGIRPSTPLPGMPQSSSLRSRPPPTSYRPVSANGTMRRTSSQPHSPSPLSPIMASSEHLAFPSVSLTRSYSQDGHRAASPHVGGRKRAHSLENLTDSARAIATATASPIRNLFRQSQLRREQQKDEHDQVSDDEDGIWICVDVKAPVGALDSASARRAIDI